MSLLLIVYAVALSPPAVLSRICFMLKILLNVSGRPFVCDRCYFDPENTIDFRARRQFGANVVRPDMRHAIDMQRFAQVNLFAEMLAQLGKHFGSRPNIGRNTVDRFMIDGRQHTFA